MVLGNSWYSVGDVSCLSIPSLLVGFLFRGVSVHLSCPLVVSLFTCTGLEPWSAGQGRALCRHVEVCIVLSLRQSVHSAACGRAPGHGRAWAVFSLASGTGSGHF